MSPSIDPGIEGALRKAFESAYFNHHLGITVEETRLDFASMRLPHRRALEQPAGVIHGGAIATLIDSTAGLAVFTGLRTPPQHISTIDLHVHYLGAVRDQDLIAEATVRKRGRSIVYVAVDVRAADGTDVAHGELSFRLIV